MTISVVQTLKVPDAWSGNFTANVTAGNTIFLVATAYSPSAALSSSAPLFNGSAPAGAVKLKDETGTTTGSGHVYTATWMLPAVAGGAKSVGLTITGQDPTPPDAGAVGLIAYEVAGLGSSPVLDVSNAAAGNTAALTSGASGNIHGVPAFVLGSLIVFGETVTTVGSPWTSQQFTDQFSVAGYQIATSGTSSYTYSTTAAGADSWAGTIVAVEAGSPPPDDGTLDVTMGTPDEVTTSAGVAHSTTSVSPAAGSMVRWCVAWLNSNDTLGLTHTAQDSNGTSYGAPTRAGTPGDGDGGCYLLIWDRVYATAPGPITLTVTASGSGVSGAGPSDCLILPYLITGQAADQSGAGFNVFSEVGTTTNTYEIALTTTVSGSVVFALAAPNHNGGATGPVVAISGTTTDVDWDDANVGSRGTFGRSTSATVTPGAGTYGWTSVNPSPNGYGVMASEVVPAGGATPSALLAVSYI